MAFSLSFLLVLTFCLFLEDVCVCAFEGSCRFRIGRRGCNDQMHEGVLITCDGAGKQAEFPDNLVAEAVYISFSNYNFSRLQRANFTKLRSVECLIILDSGITSIDYNAFQDMEKLHEIEIRNSKLGSGSMSFMNHPNFKGKFITVADSVGIERLDFIAGPHLSTLASLNLEDNNLNYIQPKLLGELESIHHISLDNNDLKSINWEKLTNLEELLSLRLAGNNIQTIPEAVDDIFEGVKELKLAGNPLHCNCKLRWLKEFYEVTDDKVLDYEDIYCVSPFKRRMAETVVEDFACGQPSAPEITWYEFDAPNEELKYVVNCSSSADPAPTLTLILPDLRKLVAPPHEDLAQLKTHTPKILTNPGKVICQATNSEGDIISVSEIPMTGASTSVKSVSLLLLVALLGALVFSS